MKANLGAEVIVFLGPSLPRSDAGKLAPCTVLPPARQGDLFRAMVRRPRAIALIDGVFESQPSVWHHEILSAMAAGITVFGGASMGALRAAELSVHGMVGVGRIFEWYRSGAITDDAEVALLHADAEHDYRAATVPLVNVRHACAEAVKAKILSGKEAATLLSLAERTYYQDRSWGALLRDASSGWSAAASRRFHGWVREGLPDLKREDAIACLKAASAFVASQRGAPRPPAMLPRATPSSLVRRRALHDGVSILQGDKGEVSVPSSDVLAELFTEAEAGHLADDGLRRTLLAGLARSLGLSSSSDERRTAEARWLDSLGVDPEFRVQFLKESGLDELAAERLCEELALEALLLEHAPRILNDGPSKEEALATEARVRGLWAATVRRLASPRKRRR